jgi:tetratricopeptide (TPR) repeat protein
MPTRLGLLTTLLGFLAIVDLLMVRAGALSMSDQDAKAINDYRKVLQLEPGNTKAMAGMAAILEFMPGHETEALDLYKGAAREETNVKEKERLAFCIAVLENRLQEESSSAVGCWNIGNRFMVQGKTDLAEKYYSKAIDLDPELFQAHYGRALLGIKTGDLQSALNDLNAAVSLAPSTRGFLTTRGLLHEAAGRFARARVDFRRATRIDPRDPEPHYHLGRLYEKDEAYSQALESYTEALRWRPKNELRDLIRQRAVAVMPLVKLHVKPTRDIIFEDDLW